MAPKFVEATAYSWCSSGKVMPLERKRRKKFPRSFATKTHAGYQQSADNYRSHWTLV